MSAPPYMKLFWGDYHKATRHLTRDQHGAYFLLIGEAWRLGGALPDDDAILAAWALCTASEWASMKPVITDFFSLRRGRWLHERVREELARYETTSRKRKEAGKTGGMSSAGKQRENEEANASLLPTEPEPEPYTEVANAPSVVRAVKPKAKASRQCPEGWMPTPEDLQVGADEGFSPGEIERELSKMRDWTFKTARSDWSGVFRNWMRTAAERRPNRNIANGQPQPSRAYQHNERKSGNLFEAAKAVSDRRRGLQGGG